MMESEMKNVTEDDHQQMVSILRKLSKSLGIKINDRVEDANILPLVNKTSILS